MGTRAGNPGGAASLERTLLWASYAHKQGIVQGNAALQRRTPPARRLCRRVPATSRALRSGENREITRKSLAGSGLCGGLPRHQHARWGKAAFQAGVRAANEYAFRTLLRSLFAVTACIPHLLDPAIQHDRCRDLLSYRFSLQVQKAGVGTLPQAVSVGRFLTSRMPRLCTSRSTMKSGVLVALTANTSAG